MKAYKGFNKDMTCRGFQYEVGKEYHEDEAKLCESGFHACKNPLDCFGYYDPANSVYHEVELNDISDETSDDSKVCGKSIKIGARINILSMVNIAVEYIKSNIVDSKTESNPRNQSTATNTDTQSAATNTGTQSAATNTGNQSVATTTGEWSATTNTGDLSIAATTGRRSAAATAGRRSIAATAGNQSAAATAGNQSAAITTGDWSAASVGSKDSIAIASGIDSKAKASLGSAICICERGEWDGETYPLLAVKAAIIDGEILKPDTWYKLVNGEFVESE